MEPTSDGQTPVNDAINPLADLTPFELLMECRDLGMEEVVKLVRQCVDVESVLILGENGTGKELIARALHERGKRSKGPLWIVDCANLTPDQMRSELFGHEKGAFTGAIEQRKGAFELANRGVLFLDEIGEIPLDLQAGLLRALQEHRFRRLGGSIDVTSDFNLIAATNRDIRHMLEAGTFRKDLYYRIEQFVITAPPLRERNDDIVRLANHFVDQFSNRQKRLSVASETFLRSHCWPGNVRELRNCIIRGVHFSNGTGTIEPAHLRLQVIPHIDATQPRTSESEHPALSLMERTERGLIVETLRRTNGNKFESARIIGIGRQTLYNKIAKYMIGEHEY